MNIGENSDLNLSRLVYGEIVKEENRLWIAVYRNGEEIFRIGPYSSIGSLRRKISDKGFEKELADNIIPKLGINDVKALIKAYQEVPKLIVKQLEEKAKELLRKGKIIIKEFTTPSETTLYLKKLLHVVYNEIIEVWQNGYLTIIDEGTPRANSQIYDIINNRKVAEVYYGDYAEQVSWRTILEKYGIDPDTPYIVRVKRIPWYFFYITDNNRLVITDRHYKLGYVKCYVNICTKEKIAKIFEEITDIDLNTLSTIIRKHLKLKVGKEEIDYEKLAERTYIAEEQLEDNVLDYFLEPTTWNNVLEKAFPRDLDPLIRETYKGETLPFTNIQYSPHLIIYTNTKAGKTTLANAINKAYANVTPITLIGGVDPKTKTPTPGVIHGQDVMIQIESLESKSADETLRYALTYMSHGFVSRAVGLHDISSVGTAPLVFTGNTLSGSLAEFQNSLKLLINNPEGLGSRTILFYKSNCREAKNIPNEEFNNAWKIIRGVRSNRKLKSKLRKIWNHPKVREFLLEDVKLPEEVKINIETLPKEYSYVQIYLKNMVKYCSWRLRALALNNVLLDYLPKIWFNNIENVVDEIIEEAEEKLEVFKGFLIYSIGQIVKDVKLIEQGEILSTLPYYVRVVIYGIAKYVNEHGEFLDNEFVISLDEFEVRKSIEEKLKRGWRISRIKDYIRRNILTLQTCTVLKDFGIEFIIAEDVKVKVNKEQIGKIALSELESKIQI